ncbi:MAG: glyoxalase [Gammaproteobacteria bacterium]|nr:MAG: glyoxalase [Gammaproteobacteria bacterium]
MTTKINYIELPAADLQAIKTFYRNVFGWKFKDFGKQYTAFKKSGIRGGFYQSRTRMSVASGSALVVLYHKRLKKIQKKIVKNGGKITVPTFDFPGGRRFHFKDVNGNELAVWSDKN